MAVSVGHSHLLKASLHSGLSENALFFLYPILESETNHFTTISGCVAPLLNAFLWLPKKTSA